MGILDYLTCFLRNLYAGEEATVFVIYTVKVFVVINKAEDVFLEFSCFFYDPTVAAAKSLQSCPIQQMLAI